MQPTDTTSAVLRHALRVLRRRLWLVVVCVVVAAAGAYAISAAKTKEYTASASLLFTNQSAVQQVSGVAGPAINDPTGQRATNLLLVQLSNQAVSQKAAAALSPGPTAAQIRNAVTASQAGQSDIVSISATWTNSIVAARIANAYMQAFIAEQRIADQATVQSAITLVQQQFNGLTKVERSTPQGQSLLDRIESLKVIRAMQNNEQAVHVATPPSTPSSPKLTRNVLLGAVLGLLLGLGLAFVLDGLDQRLREPEAVEESFRVPMLGLVPHGEGRPPKGAANGWALNLEPFRMLRANLRYFNVDRELRTLLVTSPFAAEGKTTVAFGLAAATASMGGKALLIEADLRAPVLEQTLGLRSGIGLSGALIAPDRLEAAIQQASVGEHHGAGPGSYVLDVLPSGVVPPNPAEMLESQAMQDLLAWARQRYDVVVLDTAPLSVVPDSVALIEHVDGVIAVSRLGHSRRDAAARLRERLSNLHAPLLGVVVNDLRTRSGSYGGYGYGYQTPPGQAARLPEEQPASPASTPVPN